MMNPLFPTPPAGPQQMDQRRQWLMGQLANKNQGQLPGPGRVPTMQEQQMAGEAGRMASPPQSQPNPMAPDLGAMGQQMQAAVRAPVMRPNPAPAMPSMHEQSGQHGMRSPALPRWR